MSFLTRLWFYLRCIGRLFVGAPPPELPPGNNPLALPAADLSSLTVTVFVREPNDSRTNIEHYLEQELIDRGARVVIASQKAGIELVKNGNFEQLAVGSNFSLVGTLTTITGLVVPRTYWAETEFAFAKREAKFEQAHNNWEWEEYDEPEPVLEARRTTVVDEPAKKLQLNFRIIGSDGAILASGTVEEVVMANEAMPETTLVKMAKETLKNLDGNDVWKNIVIS